MGTVSYKSPSNENHLITLSVTIILGICCAFLAVLFTKLTTTFFYLRKRFTHSFLYRHQATYVILVAGLTAVVTFPRLFGEYMSLQPFPTMTELLQSDKVPTDSELSDSGYVDTSFGRLGPIVGLSIMLVCRVNIKYVQIKSIQIHIQSILNIFSSLFSPLPPFHFQYPSAFMPPTSSSVGYSAV